MPKTEELRAIHTKQILRDTMQLLLQTRDIELITTNEICRTAAVSRATFYIHYEDKYDLLVECIYRLIFSAAGPLTEETLEEFFEQALNFARDDHEKVGRLPQVFDSAELMWRVNEMFQKEFERYFERKYPQGRPDGMTAEMLAKYHSHGIIQLSLLWQQQRYPIPNKTLAAYMAEQLRRS